MFPTNRIGLSYKPTVVGTDELGDDILGSTYEELAGVILAPDSTVDLAEPHQRHDALFVELHLPVSFTASVAGASFVALDGPFTGRQFEIEGDSLPYAWTPLPWNRRIRAREIYR